MEPGTFTAVEEAIVVAESVAFARIMFGVYLGAVVVLLSLLIVKLWKGWKE